MMIAFDYSLYEPEEIEADRKLRFKALRKIQRADWACQESEPDDAIRDLRSAGALVLKMKEPSVAAMTFIAQAIADVSWDECGVDTTQAFAALVYEGEELAQPCDYGMA